MKQDRPSLTAYMVAFMRAVHQVLDHPIVFEDPIALQIIGPEGNLKVQKQKRRFKKKFPSRLRAFLAARSRLVEDELASAVRQNVCQYVILGAGLDTFAYRNPHPSMGLKIFEVDHPATQQWKQKKLQEAQIPVPENLTFVPIDFEKQSISEQLQNAGYNPDEPAVFSWLGVTMYISYETMMNTLRFIRSSSPAGSVIIFDYFTRLSSKNFLHQILFHLLSYRFKMIGEPLVNLIVPDSLVTDVKNLGFTQVRDLGPDEINAQFFNNRSDHLRVGKLGHIMKAQI